MASNDITFSLMTFNLHGFNQGELYLREICETVKYDLICLQEHWLSPDKLISLKSLSDNYLFYGKSAMEASISAGYLRGRPWGALQL